MTFLLFEIHCEQILGLLTFCHPLPIKINNLSSLSFCLVSKSYLGPGSYLRRKIQKFFFPLPSFSVFPHSLPPSNLLSSPIAFTFQTAWIFLFPLLSPCCQVIIISQFDHCCCLLKNLYTSFHALLQLFSVVTMIFLKCKT